jgi:hypothetical protein
VLSNLRDVPSVKVVLNPQPALMMEAFASCLNRRVDAQILRGGGELSDELVLCEELDDLFANGSILVAKDRQTGALFLLLAEGGCSADC